MTSLRKIRVMLVDDSAVIRGFVTRLLEGDPEIEVVASCHNGESAVAALAQVTPDIILLDVEMPVMDGLTAIPLLLQKQPGAKIIMCSTLTVQNGATTLKAMTLGAVDCVAKPTSTQEIFGQNDFRTTVLNKIKMITGSEVRKAGPAHTADSPAPGKALPHTMAAKAFKLRPAYEGWNGKPEIVAIGSSTGGPNALFKVLSSCAGFDVPIIITQHMPPTFTRILAEHVQANTGIPTLEGRQDMKLENGKIYVAPGGFHMKIMQKGFDKLIALDDGPPENYCRPSVDPMLRSLIPLYRNRILTVILTGLGHDGRHGSEDVAKAGGRVIAQDEASSVIWGMPGAVALAGICSAVLPIDEIGPTIRKAVIRIGADIMKERKL